MRVKKEQETFLSWVNEQREEETGILSQKKVFF